MMLQKITGPFNVHTDAFYVKAGFVLLQKNSKESSGQSHNVRERKRLTKVLMNPHIENFFKFLVIAATKTIIAVQGVFGKDGPLITQVDPEPSRVYGPLFPMEFSINQTRLDLIHFVVIVPQDAEVLSRIPTDTMDTMVINDDVPTLLNAQKPPRAVKEVF